MSTSTDHTSVVTGRAPVPGGELDYDVRGSGRPVVLLNSGGTDRHLWDAETDALAADHLVVRYDARGHGRSTSPTADWSFHEDLRAVLAHLGIERPTLKESAKHAAAVGLLEKAPKDDFAKLWDLAQLNAALKSRGLAEVQAL